MSEYVDRSIEIIQTKQKEKNDENKIDYYRTIGDQKQSNIYITGISQRQRREKQY